MKLPIKNANENLPMSYTHEIGAMMQINTVAYKTLGVLRPNKLSIVDFIDSTSNVTCEIEKENCVAAIMMSSTIRARLPYVSSSKIE